MLRIISIASILLIGLAGQAQTPEQDYFPVDVMKQEDIRAVGMYETRIDDPGRQSGAGNRIRMSRDLKKETYFSKSGTKERTLFFKEDHKTLKDYLIYRYNAKAQMESKSYHHGDGKGGSGDSTAKADDFHRDTEYSYDSQGRLQQTKIYVGSKSNRELSDSTGFVYDKQGRIETETRYVIGAGKTIKNYVYSAGRKTEITSMAGPVVMRRELIVRDEEGRITSLAMYVGEEESPRYSESYVYDPRGWLEEIAYEYDWNFYKRFESVVSQKNKYDDHGKLVEIQMIYGNNKRLMRFFDYTYYVGE